MASVPAAAAASAVVLARRRKADNSRASRSTGCRSPARYGRVTSNTERRYYAPAFQWIRTSAAVQSSEQLLTEVPVTKDPPDTPDIPDTDDSDSGPWKTFVENASGEWDGYGADFNFLGEPTELPSAAVPDAFRDWGLEVHDWQTMCSTLGKWDKGTKAFGYKSVRLLPTVGCEADAATPYSIDERDFETSLTYAYHTNGSYTAVWPGKAVVKTNTNAGGIGKCVIRDVNATNEWEVEHCLVKAKGRAQKDRVRILQQFSVDGSTGVSLPKLKNITIYSETWDGPFNNGESLGGCSISGSGFATTPTLESRKLAGSWDVEKFTSSDGSLPKLLVVAETSKSVHRTGPSREELLTLPKNLWSSVKSSKDGASSTIEAGWLVNPNESIVSSLEVLASGEFREASIRFEQRKD